MNIRPMLRDDIPACARWVAETDLWKRYGVTETSVAERFQSGLADEAMIYVAEVESQIIGFIWIVERGAFNRSEYIQLIGVRSDERGRGIGRALMDFAETKLFAQARDIFLLVSDFNIDAQRFYQRLGYQQGGSLQDYVARGVCELVFWKRLR